MPSQASGPSQVFSKRSKTSPVFNLWAFLSTGSAMVKVVVSVTCVFFSGKAVCECVLVRWLSVDPLRFYRPMACLMPDNIMI
eukprot:IDg17935t1